MATEKMTLIERLRNPQYYTTDSGPSGHSPRLVEFVALAVMKEAADEIEYLRSLAGAVSRGQSFGELRDTAKSTAASKEN